MKLLLLLLILSPFTLFGQMRRKAIVDSIKAEATNLQGISTLISNNRDAKVANIHVSDSGEYVTVVVRVHVTEARVIKILPTLAIVKMKVEEIVAGATNAVSVPPLPRPIKEADTIVALRPCTVFKFNTDGIPVVSVDTLTVPPIPVVDLETMEALPVTFFKIEVLAIGWADTLSVPPLPEADPETVEALPVTLFRIEDIVIGIGGTATIPALPDVEFETMGGLPLFAVVELAIKDHPACKMDTMALPSFEEKKMPISGIHLSAEGYSLLEKLEGFSPMLYSLKDGGFTIGFGFFIPYGEGGMWSKGVTWEEAERLIRQKVPAYEDQVKKYINVPVTQNEFDALTMLAYNLGGFSKATSIVNDVNMQADFDKLQSDWKRFVHSKAPGVTKGLMNRRKDELDVRNESNYQPERKIQILKY